MTGFLATENTENAEVFNHGFYGFIATKRLKMQKRDKKTAKKVLY